MPPVFALLIVLAFMALIFGAIAFSVPILKAASDRIAGRIGPGDTGPVGARDLARLQEAVQDLERQVHTLQEQHNFLEQLIAGRSPDALPPADTPGTGFPPRRPAGPHESQGDG